MNRYEWNRSLIEPPEVQHERAYRIAMEPIVADFIKQFARLPTRYILNLDGTLTLDEGYPPEREALRQQLATIAKAVYESLRVE